MTAPQRRDQLLACGIAVAAQAVHRRTADQQMRDAALSARRFARGKQLCELRCGALQVTGADRPLNAGALRHFSNFVGGSRAISRLPFINGLELRQRRSRGVGLLQQQAIAHCVGQAMGEQPLQPVVRGVGFQPVSTG